MSDTKISRTTADTDAVDVDVDHLRQEHAVLVQTLSNDHQIAVEALSEHHQNEIDQLRKEHRRVLQQVERDRQRDIAKLEKAAIEADAHSLERREEEHAAELAELRSALSDQQEDTLVELRVGLNERYQESLDQLEQDLRSEHRAGLEAVQAELRATHKAEQERMRAELRSAHLNEMLQLEEGLRQGHELELTRAAQTTTDLYSVELDGVRASEQARLTIELEHVEQQHQADLVANDADHQLELDQLRTDHQQTLDAYRAEIAEWRDEQEAYYKGVLGEFARLENEKLALVAAHEAELGQLRVQLEAVRAQHTALTSEHASIVAERAGEGELARDYVAVVAAGYQDELARSEEAAVEAIEAVIADHAATVAKLHDEHDLAIARLTHELSLHHDQNVTEEVAARSDDFEALLHERGAAHEHALSEVVTERDAQGALVEALTSQVEVHRARVEELETNLSAQVVELTQNHARALEKAATAVANTRETSAVKQAEFLADYETRLEAIADEHSAQTTELEEQYAELVDELRSTHADELTALRHNLKEAGAQLESERDVHRQAISELATQHSRELDGFVATKDTEIERSTAVYEERLTSLANVHKAELRGMARDMEEAQRQTAVANAERLQKLRLDFEAASSEIERTHELRYQALQRRFDAVTSPAIAIDARDEIAAVRS